MQYNMADSIEMHPLNPFEESSSNIISDNTKNGNLDDFTNAEKKKEKICNLKKSSDKKKVFIFSSIAVSCILLLSLLFLLLSNTKKSINSNSNAPNKYSFELLPNDLSDSLENGSSGVYPAGQNENNTSINWRLDTANNYTSNLQYWRDDFGTAKDRHYFFNITYVEKIDANGAVRNLTVINNQFPGPLLEANSGDTIYLHVNNQMNDEPVSFHLHGLFYPNNTFDDGASSINVCPIPPGGNYTYRIPVGKKEYGTYWYHSHWSTQYADGVYGPIILHSPIEDANLTYYDADRIFVVNDYYYTDASNLLGDYLVPGNENSEPSPDAGLISGTYSQASNYLTAGDNNNKFRSATYFDPNLNYRIRVANVGFFIPFEFSIDLHTLTLIETDGTLIEPLETDYVDIAVGERYSFFLNRTNTDFDAYWIHARFNQFCLKNANPNLATDVQAIVSYNSVFETPETSQTWTYSGGTPKCLSFPQDKLRTLNQQVPMNKNGSTRPDLYVELDVSFTQAADQMTYGFFNQYTWDALSNTSSMHELLFNQVFRNVSHVENQQTYNNHQYMLNFDDRGMIVDFLINNFDDGSHPFHLHGYKYWVLANSDSGSFYPNFYEDHPEKLDLTNPVLRDTVGVAPFGFAVLRFVVDNPGVFPFHCHIGWHIEAGLLLQVNALQSEWMKQDYNPQWKQMCGYDFSNPELSKLQIGMPN
jgi:FtsP/CotA-like multicopper oxidase with cupredoxin domain